MRTFIYIFCLIVTGSTFAQENEDWRLFPASKNPNSVIKTDYSLLQKDTLKKEQTLKVITEITPSETQGEIKINKDSKIDDLVKELGTVKPGKANVQIDGYRLQIIASSNKDLVTGERSKFVATYPSIRPYMKYDQPNFRLRVGDFRTKLEAQKLQNDLKDVFPYAIVVKDKIELPKIP